MSATKVELKLVYHELTAATFDDEIFDSILDFSRSIFNPYFPPEILPSRESEYARWNGYINENNSVIYYATTAESAKPIGFFFSHPGNQPEVGNDLMHLSMAAVEPSFRGSGIFRVLMDRTIAHASSCGYQEMTVNTWPEHFAKMYEILQKHGWKEVARREEGRKVLMKKSI